MKKILFLVATLAVGLLSPLAESAGPVIYTGGPPLVPGGEGQEATRWVEADDFTLGSDALIGGAGFWVGSESGDLSRWDGTLEYFIYSDAGGLPGSVLVSGNGQNVTTTETATAWGFGGNYFLFEFDLESAFSAVAGTNYWLGIHLSSDFVEDELYWAVTQEGSSALSFESYDSFQEVGTTKQFYLTGAVSVPEPGELLQQLGTAVTGVGPGNSLADKIELAQTYLAVPDVPSTCAVLNAFLNQVRAQSGKKLPVALAVQLNADAQAIMFAIGCN